MINQDGSRIILEAIPLAIKQVATQDQNSSW